MFKTARLTVSLLLASSALIACGGDDAAETSHTPSPSAIAVATESSVKAGTSEKDVAAKLGEPTLTQSYTIGALTVTHSEWTTEEGTTSVQFQNGEAKFSLFIPAIAAE